MLSLKQCREFLIEDLSDEELDQLRTHLYALADIATTVSLERHSVRSPNDSTINSAESGFRIALSIVHPDKHEEIEERAAILEFDGGLSQEEAELRTFQELISNQNGGGDK